MDAFENYKNMHKFINRCKKCNQIIGYGRSLCDECKEQTFWQKLNRAVNEKISDPIKTGIEKCSVKVDDKDIEISFNHSTGEITLIKGENNG